MITIEDKYFPLILYRYVGDISLEDYENHRSVQDVFTRRAVREGTYIAAVVDTTQQSNIPPAVRNKMSTGVELPRSLGTWVTLTPMSKLVLTALRWTGAKGLAHVFPCTSIEAAVREACQALRYKGVTVPTDLETRALNLLRVA